MTDLDYIPPTPVYDLEKIQWHNIGWVSTVGRIVNDDLDKIEAAIGGGGGSGNYEALTNKPQINSVTLSGNKTLSDLGIQYSFTAGNGIAINDTSKTISVAVDGTTIDFDTDGKLKALSASASFASLTGSPTDNTALAAALDSKIDKVSGSDPVSIGTDSVGPYLSL